MVIDKRYIFIYFVNKETVFLETILDCRQNNTYLNQVKD